MFDMEADRRSLTKGTFYPIGSAFSLRQFGDLFRQNHPATGVGGICRHIQCATVGVR